MKAFKNNPKIKADLIAQLEAHYAEGEIVKGTSWEDGKGSAVGCCSLHCECSLFPKLFGIPESIAILMNSIFEKMPDNRAKLFPLRIIRAIPVGSDLSKIENLFLEWLLIDPMHGVIRFNPDPSILKAADLHRRIIDGGAIPPDNEWDAAATAAASLAVVAAATRDADAAATATAIWTAALAKARAAQAEKLIELFLQSF